MGTTAALTDSDSRCGTQWLARVDSEARMQMLVAVISRFNHDLRTPLNTILGWTHLLQKGGLDPIRSKHVADVIARNSREQTHLLEEFVDDGRAILGTLQLQTAVVSITELVLRAIERLGSVLTLHGASLQQNLDSAQISVNGDARRLERLAYRLMAIVTRRAREGSSIAVETDIEHRLFTLSIAGSAFEPDWSDAALLDLRISTLVAALHDGELNVGADPTRPCIVLKLKRN